MSARDDLKPHMQSIGKTLDGRELRKYLESVLRDCEPRGRSDGALREENGRRNFALELIQLFEGGEVERSEYTGTERGSGTTGGSGQPIARGHGAQRRVVSAEPAKSDSGHRAA